MNSTGIAAWPPRNLPSCAGASREVQTDQTALQRRQHEFESYAVAAPSATWPEAAAKARYLIQLFAVTPEAQDPRRQQLIAKVLDELARLSD